MYKSMSYYNNGGLDSPWYLNSAIIDIFMAKVLQIIDYQRNID